MKKPVVSIIAAMSRNRVIGNGLEIPWRIKGEQLRFKELTIGKTIIMGRKTFQSIGRALPGRKTIVITRDPKFAAPGCQIVDSLEAALAACAAEDETLVVGGGQVYAEALGKTQRIYLTIIEQIVEGDIFFPEFDTTEFLKTHEEPVPGEQPFTYYTFERRPAAVETS
jgi:dihydrofolate reductase (trimethoprim resistance protein)